MAHVTKTNSHHFPTHIDIKSGARGRLIAMLDQDLACTFDLASQVKQAHWNVKGKEFYPLHLLFDEIAEELVKFVDELAERITSLGGYAHGTVRMAAEHSSLPEYPTEIDGVQMETYIDWMKSAYYITLTGLPAISVPCGFTDDGLPVGIQIVGRWHDDFGVLQIARAFEQATQVWKRRPPVVVEG